VLNKKPTSSTSIAMLLKSRNRETKKTAKPFLNAMFGIVPVPFAHLPYPSTIQSSPARFLMPPAKLCAVSKKKKIE
jgi:hypothetical protein